MYLDLVLKDLENRLSFLLKGKYWLLKIIFFSIFLFIVVDFSGNLSKLVYFKDFWKDSMNNRLDETHTIILKQSQNYFAFFKNPQGEMLPSYQHEAKMKFRLFLPILVRFLGVNNFAIWLYGLAVVLGIFYMYIVAKMSLRILGENVNRVLFLFFMIGFGNLYAGAGSFILDIAPYGDFFAFLFLLLGIYFKNPFIILVCSQCAFWVDERALINAIYVILWWSFISLESNTFKFKFSYQALAVVISGVIYMLIRGYLKRAYQLYDTVYIEEFISTFYENLKMMSLRIWVGFDGMWMLILLGIIILFKEKKFLFFLTLLGCLIFTTAFSFIAYDVNRGLSYSFIVLFLALAICKKYLSEKELKYVLFVCMIVSVLSPTLNRFRVVGGWQFV